MQFLEYISLLQKHGLPFAIYGISFFSPKLWTTICNLWNFFLISKNMDYHMQSMECLPHPRKHGLSYVISRIFSLLQKCRLSYAIFEISFSSPKTWTIISSC